MVTLSLESRIEKVDTFIVESAKFVASTMLEWSIEDMKRRTAELGYNGLLAPPLVMQGDSIVVEPKDAPIVAWNRFSIPELKQELNVRVFAKLDA